jgi:hypothetical protein
MTNDTMHLFVVVLSKIKIEDLASQYVIVKPLEIDTCSTRFAIET